MSSFGDVMENIVVGQAVNENPYNRIFVVSAYKDVTNYLLEHKKMTLSTVTDDGQPIAHTVQYASSGNTVYFFTKPTQRKVVNIRANQRVAYAVDHDYDDWSKIQGVQMIGSARILEIGVTAAPVNGSP